MTEELPRNARVLERLAGEHGWTVATKWGDGVVTKRGGEMVLARSVSVWCDRGDAHLRALWVNNRFTGGWAWRDGQWPQRVVLDVIKNQAEQ